MKKLCVLLGLLVLGAAFARADEFWITWEGETYPEEDGWERIIYGGGTERWFEDGSLVLDGLPSIDISDFYRMVMPSEPGAEEVFVLQWRLRVDEVHGFADPAMAVDSSHGTLVLWYTEDSIYSMYEGVWIDFASGSFHEYSLTSADMQTYSLHIDDQLAYVGQFVGPALESRVIWGDATRGARSLSVWDYVRFGVVPEPSAGLLLGFAGLAVMGRKARPGPGRGLRRSEFRARALPSEVTRRKP